MGSCLRHECQTKTAKLVIRMKTAQRIHRAPNQSSSWPLSRMIWSSPVQTTSAPKPMLSKAGTRAFLMYGGSWMKRLIMNRASMPMGMLM